MEKVYVAVGNDEQEGFNTLQWTFRHWCSQSISLVILHLDTTSRELVSTPFGKLPPSAVSDEKLEDIRQLEQEKVDKLLSKYLTLCDKARTQVLKIERSDEQICSVIVGLITRLRIAKLVIGISLFKSSFGKTRSSIGASFYVYKHKPEYCELFMLCGAKLVFLKKQNEEEYLEDEQGVKLKEKSSLKGWLGKKITDTQEKDADQRLRLSTFHDQHKNYTDAVANYLALLSKFDPDDEDGATELLNLDQGTSTTCNGSKIGIMEAKINKAKKIIQEKTKEAKANIDKQKGAERIILLCSERANELQSNIDKEIESRVALQRELDASRQEIDEMARDIEEHKNRLRLAREQKSELERKLMSDSFAKPLAELELQKAVTMRGEILSEIEKLREQKDVLRRGVEFYTERISNDTCKYREFTQNEIRDATNNFDDFVKLKSGSGFSCVCKGKINDMAVAIKLQTSYNHQELHDKVEILCDIRHPNIVSTIGACFDPKCIVFEYLPNGSLEEIFSSQRETRNRRLQKLQAPSWHTRIQIASQICSGLGFLHSAKPWPVVHNDLKPCNILLDRNLVPKINNIRLTPYYHEQQLRSDVRDFGYIMLFLLTGRGETDVIADMALAVQTVDVSEALHNIARDWPLALAEEFACLAMRCVAIEDPDLSIVTVTKELENLLKKAKKIREMAEAGLGEEKVFSDIPNDFICPINQDLMKNPYIAADGFSYELEAIEGWLKTGSTKSPMTNLILKHTNLTPNRILRSLITDWRKRSSALT